MCLNLDESSGLNVIKVVKKIQIPQNLLLLYCI